MTFKRLTRQPIRLWGTCAVTVVSGGVKLHGWRLSTDVEWCHTCHTWVLLNGGLRIFDAITNKDVM